MSHFYSEVYGKVSTYEKSTELSKPVFSKWPMKGITKAPFHVR